jgi:hypothetical protein
MPANQDTKLSEEGAQPEPTGPPPPPMPEPGAPEAVLEGEIVEESSDGTLPADGLGNEFDDEDDGFIGSIEGLFGGSGFGLRPILSCFFGIILLVGIAWGGIWGYGKFFGGDEDSASEDSAVKEDVKIIDGGVDAALHFGRYLVPDRYFTEDDIIFALQVGNVDQLSDRFAQAVLLLRRMESAYSTNIDTLLNSITDRRAALKNYIARLEDLHKEGEKTVQQIVQKLNQFDIAFEVSEEEQRVLEDTFFTQLNSLNPAASTFLNNFVVTSRNGIEQKARFRAWDRLGSFYQQALPRIGARIKDLQLNEEPIVQGIKVFDVEGSDLQLIIREEGFAASSDSDFFSAQTGFSGKDFITQPPPLPSTAGAVDVVD